MKTTHSIPQANSTNKVWKYCASVLLGIACTALSVYAYSELMPLLYMYSNGVEIRAELSEDYGFGMVMFFGEIGLAVLLFPLYSILIYARLTRLLGQEFQEIAE